MTRCCVPKCSKIGVHHFPKDAKIRKLWVKAVRRREFIPTTSSRLCREHFTENDYEKVNKYTGLEHQHQYLKKTAIPSVFPWNKKTPTKSEKDREERYLRRCLARKQLFSISEEVLPLEPTTEDISDEVEIAVKDDSTSERMTSEKAYNTCGTQTPNIMRLFSTDLLQTDDDAVNYYTGLETYAKLLLVFSTLLPMANQLKFRWSQVVGLSVVDQFIMLLMKLHCNKPDFELSRMFGVSKTEVSNIIVTWINFVSDLWSLIDIWPSRELVNFYMPQSFQKHYRSTRVIIDGTEIPIQKPSQPDAQKTTFSSYKHKNTLKFLVGASPGGLLTYCSGAYAGSASDRQIVERSNLLEICEEGDSIMADRGFNVQDLFASKGVGINIPTFLKGKSQIPGVLLKNDQKLASQRVHIERLIGLTKTYKILTSELNKFYVPLASKIFFICLMLCNFREGIIKKKKSCFLVLFIHFMIVIIQMFLKHFLFEIFFIKNV